MTAELQPSASPIRVRAFEPRDRDAVERLWADVFPDDRPWNAPARLVDRKQTVQPGLLLVATAGDEIVGAVMAGFDGTRGWMHHLAVAPAWRRRGVATALVRAAEAGLRRLGCPKLNLQVVPENAGVVAFYRRLGFEVEARISMGRRLEPASVESTPTRLAAPSDIPAIEALMRSIAGLWDDAWRPDVVARVVGSSDAIAVVHGQGTAIDGFACAHDVGFRAYLSELAVDPGAQGQGIGHTLLADLEQRLSARGCQLVIADVWRDAEPFYRAQGWMPPGVVLLRKRLASSR